MKMGYFIFLIAVLFFALLGNSYSDEFRRSIVIVLPNINPTINVHKSNGTAMALAASEINPTLLSSKWQMGVGFGNYNDNTAIAIGIAKRVNKSLLFSGKVAGQNNEVGTSLGLNFKF